MPNPLFSLLSLPSHIRAALYGKYIHHKTNALKAKTSAYCKAFETSRSVGEPVTIVQYASPFSYGLQYPHIGQDNIDRLIIHIVEEIRSTFDKKYLSMKKTPNNCKYYADTTLLLSYETYTFALSHLSLIFFETHESMGASASIKIHAYHFDLRQNRKQSASALMYRDFREKGSLYVLKHFLESESYKSSLFKNYKDTLAVKNGLFDRFALTHDGVMFFIEPNVILPESYGLLRPVVPYENIQPDLSIPNVMWKKHSQIINPLKPMVALTFDDGPNPIYTNLILDTLEKYNVTATFFDIGKQMERYPYVCQRESALNCEIGSHSYGHNNFTRLSDDEIKTDIKETLKIFHKVLGQVPTLFRPPGGQIDQRIRTLVPASPVLWSLDTKDWKSRSPKITMAIIKNSGNLDGKIILMHSIYESSAKAVTMLVPYLLDKGYQLVTVSQLLTLRNHEAH